MNMQDRSRSNGAVSQSQSSGWTEPGNYASLQNSVSAELVN